MGPVTEEEYEKQRTQFVSISQETGKLIINKKEYPAIKGVLNGFSKHEYEFKGEMQVKFDIYLMCDETEYQVQLGMYSWITLGVLNSLSSIEHLGEAGDEILQLASFKDGENYSIFLQLNGKNLKWKRSMDELKLTGLDKPKKKAKRDKIIDAMFEKMHGAMPHSLVSKEVAAATTIDDDEMPDF